MSRQQTSPGYMPQLDGVRAIAIAVVLFSHWAPEILPDWLAGITGVRLFFVTSGLLITGILLDARDRAELGLGTIGGVMRAFYARRALRIFPVYYLTLAVAALAGVASIRDPIWWHALYGTNILFALRGNWMGEATHLWSLAVEEQFYLFWPWVILLLPRRVLLPASVVAVAIGPISRFVFSHLFGSEMAAAVLTPTALDTLGLGAVFALLGRESYVRGASRNVGRYALWLGIFGVSVWALANLMPVHLGFVPVAFFEALSLAAFVIGAARGFRGVIGWALDNPIVSYIGKISYGIYLFHLFTPLVLRYVFDRIGVTILPTNTIYGFLANFGFLVIVSSLSWHLFESPINRLKIRFPYVGRPVSSGGKSAIG